MLTTMKQLMQRRCASCLSTYRSRPNLNLVVIQFKKPPTKILRPLSSSNKNVETPRRSTSLSDASSKTWWVMKTFTLKNSSRYQKKLPVSCMLLSTILSTVAFHWSRISWFWDPTIISSWTNMIWQVVERATASSRTLTSWPYLHR
jgi:hypothetical protein